MIDVMSEAYGRELVARTQFEKEGVWAPLLAMHALNAGEPVITGKTFTECLIEGPAVIAVMGNTRFDGCDMGWTQDSNSLLLKPQGPHLVGVIGFKDCLFVRCRLRHVGYTGHDDLIEAMKTGISSTSKVKA